MLAQIELTEEERKKIEEVFNGLNPGPPTTTTTSTTAPEDINIVPSTAPTMITGENGESCLCVPYYLCNPDNGTIDTEGVLDGAFQLDVRFKEDSCQESVEVCCSKPLEPAKVPVPTPVPLQHRCGIRNENGIDFQIIGGSGKEALFGEFPWTVALLNLDSSCFCSGTLIHPSVVITGAHCLAKTQVDKIKVRAGEWDTQTTKERFPHQERLARDMVIHPDFTSKSLYNDVGLIRLQEPVELAPHINVACLPAQGESFDTAKACYATGWGKDKFGKAGVYSVIMKKVDMDVVSNPRCENLLQKTRLGPRFKLHKSFLCAGGEKGKDTCQGDGGAPLVCKVGDQYRQAGIVAWGIECGLQDSPGVHARVASYRDWIDGIVKAWGYDPAVYTASD